MKQHEPEAQLFTFSRCLCTGTLSSVNLSAEFKLNRGPWPESRLTKSMVGRCLWKDRKRRYFRFRCFYACLGSAFGAELPGAVHCRKNDKSGYVITSHALEAHWLLHVAPYTPGCSCCESLTASRIHICPCLASSLRFS